MSATKSLLPVKISLYVERLSGRPDGPGRGRAGPHASGDDVCLGELLCPSFCSAAGAARLFRHCDRPPPPEYFTRPFFTVSFFPAACSAPDA